MYIPLSRHVSYYGSFYNPTTPVERAPLSTNWGRVVQSCILSPAMMGIIALELHVINKLIHETLLSLPDCLPHFCLPIGIVFRSLRVHIGAGTLAFYIIVFTSLRVHIGASTLAFYI